jgi:hypothetical protein
MVVDKSPKTISPGILTVRPKNCLSIGVTVRGGSAETLQYKFMLLIVAPPFKLASTVNSKNAGRAPPYLSAALKVSIPDVHVAI